MKSNNNIVSFIPARAGSKGIPNKNIIEIGGKKLIDWSIDLSVKSKYINLTYISTDINILLNRVLQDRFFESYLKRPIKYCTDTASLEDTLLYHIDRMKEKPEIIVLLQPTSPLRKENDIDDAIELFLNEKYDSLFSASLAGDSCIWKRKNKKLNSLTYDYKNRGRRQDWGDLYLENGSIYIFKTNILKKHHNRLGGKIGIYKMKPWQSIELDEPEDIELVEYYVKKKGLK